MINFLQWWARASYCDTASEKTISSCERQLYLYYWPAKKTKKCFDDKFCLQQDASRDESIVMVCLSTKLPQSLKFSTSVNYIVSPFDIWGKGTLSMLMLLCYYIYMTMISTLSMITWLDNQSSSCQKQSHRVISDISDLNIIESLCLVTADTAGHNPLIWVLLFISLCQHFTDNRTTNLTFDNNWETPSTRCKQTVTPTLLGI